MQKIRSCAIGALCVVVLGGVVLSAAPDSPLELLSRRLNEANQTIAKWEHSSSEQLALMIFIALCGGVSAVLQAVQRNWTKVATVVAGAAVSTLTTISGLVFDANVHTLKSISLEARGIIRDVEESSVGLDKADPASQAAAVKDLTHKLDKIDLLEVQQAGSSTSIFEISTTAYAEGRQPSWINGKEDNLFSYFVGTATAGSFNDAKVAAEQDSRAKAMASLSQGTVASTSKAYIESVVASAEVSDSYFAFDSIHGTFTYYALLRVPKSSVSRFAVASLAPALATADPEASIRQTLQAYETAFDSKNAADILKISSAQTPAALRSTFDRYRTYKLNLKLENATVSLAGNSATAQLTMKPSGTLSSGALIPSVEKRVTFHFAKEQGTWKITAIN